MIVRTTASAAACAALSALFAGTAAAQVGDWNGFYVGGHVGYAAQSDGDNETILFDKNLDGNFNDPVTTGTGANAFSPGFCSGRAIGNAPGAGCEDDEDGVDFGVRAGYDLQTGPWVFGGVVEYSSADVTDSVGAFSTTPASYTMTRELDSLLSARLRAGYGFGRYLGYVTGGVARGQISNSFETTNTVNSFPQSGDDEASGYQLGLGAETHVSPRLRLGLEYLWTSLEDDGYRVRATGPAPATNPFIVTNTAGTDFKRSDDKFEFGSLRLTAAYRF